MKNYTLILVIFCTGLLSCFSTPQAPIVPRPAGQIVIEWTNDLKGDYSFSDQWSYLPGVYKNQFGQLSCDGMCPPEIDRMKDESGKIIEDSLTVFYKLIDTTHQLHSIQCDAWCYEWAGTDFVTVEQITSGTIKCQTHTNAATHCSLVMIISDSLCIPRIELTSIVQGGSKTYTCKSGWIKIDQKLWSDGILKGEFNFSFDHPEDPKREMFWKGRINAPVQGR